MSFYWTNVIVCSDMMRFNIIVRTMCVTVPQDSLALLADDQYSG